MTETKPQDGILKEGPSVLPKGGVWAVRDYHSILEQRAIAGAAMSAGYIYMVAAATVMATAGLLLDSPAAVIGAMCVAPFMAPSRAVCIGALFRNRKVFLGGLVKQLVGLLVIGVSVAALITALLHAYLPGIGITHEILLRAMPTTRDVVLSALIAISAGAAASLALAAQPHIVESSWGQIIDAVIGVEIAISLVPPAAVIGIGLALGMPDRSLHAFYLLLLLLNVVSLDLIGSTAVLAMRGVRLKYLQLEKRIRNVVGVTLDVVPGFIAVASSVHVTLHGNRDATIDVILRRRVGGQVPESLAATIANDIEHETTVRTDVTVEIIPLLTHTGIPR
jgi:uncharacterized hydrophobic protein (TIGR00271 family)